MHDWYSEKAKRIVDLTDDGLMSDARERQREQGAESCNVYVFLSGVLRAHLREAQGLIEDLAKERTRAGLALEAMQYAAEDVLDCDEFSTPESGMPIYAWLYKAQNAYLRRMKAGENLEVLIPLKLDDEEIEKESEDEDDD